MLTMENLLIILIAAVVLLMLILLAIYNRLDRRRFRLERQLHAVRRPMDDWVRVCAGLRGGDDGGYFKLKKLSDKTACIRMLIAETKENSEEKLYLQDAMLEFCGRFNFMAEEYDRQLQSAVLKKPAVWLGFRPVGRIDFYPDIHM